MDDAYTYQITGNNVFDEIEKELNRLVELEAWHSGRPVDDLWAHIALVASRAMVTPLEGKS